MKSVSNVLFSILFGISVTQEAHGFIRNAMLSFIYQAHLPRQHQSNKQTTTGSSYLSKMATVQPMATTDGAAIKPIMSFDPAFSQSVQEYLKIREKNALKGDEIESLKNELKQKNKAPAVSPLGMVKPSGWFKDLREIDLQSRSDKRTPLIPHPLSFYELQAYGYERLSEQVIALGGPKLVGESFGIVWEDLRDEKEIWDESLRPIRQESYAMDMKGSLSLGTSFEEKLALAGEIDVESIKQRLAVSKAHQTITNTVEYSSFPNDEDPFENLDFNSKPGKESKRRKSRGAPSKVVKPQRDSERFSLTGSERVFFVAVIMFTALAHGHASQDAMKTIGGNQGQNAIDLATYASYVAYTVSAGSAFKAASTAVSKSRNPFLWGFMGLLGGPVVSSRLVGLENLLYPK